MVDYTTLTQERADQLCSDEELEEIGSGNYNKIYVPIVQESPEVVFLVSKDEPANNCVEYDNTLKAIKLIKDNEDLGAFCVKIFGAVKVVHDDFANLSVKVEKGVPIKEDQVLSDGAIASLLNRYNAIRDTFAFPDTKGENFVIVGEEIKLADIDNIIDRRKNPSPVLQTDEYSEPATRTTISFLYKYDEDPNPDPKILQTQNGFIPHSWGNAVQLQSLLAMLQTCTEFMGIDQTKFEMSYSTRLRMPLLHVDNAPGFNGTYEFVSNNEFVHTENETKKIKTVTRGVMLPKTAWIITKETTPGTDELNYVTDYTQKLRDVTKYDLSLLPLQQKWKRRAEDGHLSPHDVKITVEFPLDDKTRTSRYIRRLERCLQDKREKFPDSVMLFEEMIETAKQLHSELCKTRIDEHVLTMGSFVDLAR